MKTIVGVVLVLLLSGCATSGQGGGFFAPSMAEGNDRFISVYDAMGFPGASFNMASAHCQKFKRTAVFQGKGGSGWMCAGRNAGLCQTYTCVD